MAEPEVATKAPESDATNTTIPGDTPAQSGPTMGENCTTDRPLPTKGNVTSAGEITTLNKIECYISKPKSYPHTPAKLLLLLSGGTGLHSTNNQLQADAFAERGYLVVMPDQFNGDPVPTTTTAPSASGAEPSILEKVKMGAAEAVKSFSLDMWLARHDIGKVLPILQATLEGAREEFADAVANGGGIYGVGYCFGARYILLLCGSHPEWSHKEAGEDVEKGEKQQGPELKVGAIAHGTAITHDDIDAVRAPVALACVENDVLFPDEIREQGKASLELNAVEHDVQIYKDVPHGFATMGDYADDNIATKQKEAFEFMCGWLEKY